MACWAITKVPFVKQAGIDTKYIMLLFLVKIIAGLVIGWVSYNIYGKGNDYWNTNRDAWKEYQLLWADPQEYFTNLFRSDYSRGYGGIFDSFGSFWNDLRNNVVVKIVSVFNLFSRGNYYINSLFFNFFVFIGHVAFYRLFIQVFPRQKAGVIIGCFLLPSTLYFTAGIQKDGIVFMMLGFLVYCIYQSLQQHRVTLKRACIIMLSCILLFLIRSYVLITILPSLIAWIAVKRFKWPLLQSFVISYLIMGLLFFNINALLPSVDPLKTVVDKQAAFSTLPRASTQVNLDSLYPNFKSFAVNAPQAYNHLLLRPYPWELPAKSLLPLNIELIVYQLLFILFLFFRRKENKGDPVITFGVFFSFTIFLFIGYIMPNIGSIVRYRSIYLPFLLIPVICGINWKKIAATIKINK